MTHDEQSAAGTPHLIIPVGTQVVTRVAVTGRDGELLCPAGAVGEVVLAPLDGTHAYRVRFPDGAELSLRRGQIGIRKHGLQEELERSAGAVLGDHDLREWVIYSCVTGSHAYGLANEGSDIDRRGIYLPPARLHWSLLGVPEQLEDKEGDEVYWELEKFMTLALKANPNILECLYTPIVERALPVAEELRAMRDSFLSKVIYQTYNGYVMSQFKKLEADVRTIGAVKWKHAMHLVRLLVAGVTALREGHVPVRVEGDLRERFLAIKRGETPWAEVDSWRLSLHKEFDRALATTRLPDRPDYERANELLVSARRRMVNR